MTALQDFSISPVPLATVLRAVSEEMGVEIKEIASFRRDLPTARARQVFYWVARETTLRTLGEIGHYIDRDYSSIKAGINRINHLRQTDSGILAVTNTIVGKIGA